MLIIQMSASNKSPHQLSGTLSRCVCLRFANWLSRRFGSRWLDVNHMDVLLHRNSFPCGLLAVWSLAGFDIPLLLHVWCCPTRPPWDGGWLQWWGDALAKQRWRCILRVYLILLLPIVSFAFDIIYTRQVPFSHEVWLSLKHYISTIFVCAPFHKFFSLLRMFVFITFQQAVAFIQ